MDGDLQDDKCRGSDDDGWTVELEKHFVMSAQLYARWRVGMNRAVQTSESGSG